MEDLLASIASSPFRVSFAAVSESSTRSDTFEITWRASMDMIERGHHSLLRCNQAIWRSFFAFLFLLCPMISFIELVSVAVKALQLICFVRSTNKLDFSKRK